MCLSRHRPPTSPSLHSLPRQNQVTITVVLKTPDGIPIKLRHASISILTLWKVTANPAQATYQTFGHRAPYRLRSEEHTSELQSLMRISYAVFCLKKKTKKK